MARLPVLHKRRPSKGQRALDVAKAVATVWTTVKASSASARAAKKGAKAYGAAKGAKVGRSLVKVLAVPAAVAGAAVVWRKAHHGSDEDPGDVDRPLGPVASADTVSPSASATGAAQAREDAQRTEAHASS
jgi:hypothetical protein